MYSNIKDQPAIGRLARFNRMRKRLSAFFDDTKASGEYASNRNSKGKYVPVFITLTYKNNDQWNPEDITGYTRKLSAFAKRNWGQVLRIVWVAETTKNGIIHYHILTWIPRNQRLPKPSMPIVIQFKNGNTREYPPMWKYRAKIEGVRKSVFGYMLKYMSKGCEVGLGIGKEVNKGYEYIIADNKEHYVQIKQCGRSGSNLCLVKYDDDRMMLNKTNFKRYPFNNYLSRFDNNTCINKINHSLKINFKKYSFVTLIPILKQVYPRLYGMSGMTKAQRERIAYYSLPQYVREAFHDVKIGDRIQRIKGGFKLKKKNIVDRVWKYWTHHEPFIQCNWSKMDFHTADGSYYVGYHFGSMWSELRQEFEENVFYEHGYGQRKYQTPF